MKMQMAVRSVVVASLIVFGVSNASAQVFGTFPWQMHPYCNVVTLTLTSTPAGFTLEGSEDQCGASNKASALGVATFNAGGNVTLNFSIVTAPSGKPVHVSAIVSPANGQGTWTDSVGNSGTFAFFGNVPGLPARPLPASGLAPAIITTAEIAPGAVIGETVADGSLTRADIADAPRAAFASGDQHIALALGDAVVRTVTVTAPAPGVVIVNASGFFLFNGASASSESGRCSITTGSTIDFDHTVLSSDGGANGSDIYDGWAATRGFAVPRGPFTVNLVCDVTPGNVVSVGDTSLTAIFVAQ